jgi:hypothetical protein
MSGAVFSEFTHPEVHADAEIEQGLPENSSMPVHATCSAEIPANIWRAVKLENSKTKTSKLKTSIQTGEKSVARNTNSSAIIG